MLDGDRVPLRDPRVADRESETETDSEPDIVREACDAVASLVSDPFDSEGEGPVRLTVVDFDSDGPSAEPLIVRVFADDTVLPVPERVEDFDALPAAWEIDPLLDRLGDHVLDGEWRLRVGDRRDSVGELESVVVGVPRVCVWLTECVRGPLLSVVDAEVETDLDPEA